MTIGELQAAAELTARQVMQDTIRRWQVSGVPENAVAPMLLNETLTQILSLKLMLAHIGVTIGAVAPDPPQQPQDDASSEEPPRIITEHSGGSGAS